MKKKSFRVKVKSGTATHYSYKYGTTEETKCTEKKGYSTHVSTKSPLQVNIDKGKSEEYTLCVVGIDKYGNISKNISEYNWFYLDKKIDYDFGNWDKNSENYLSDVFYIQLNPKSDVKIEKIKIALSKHTKGGCAEQKAYDTQIVNPGEYYYLDLYYADLVEKALLLCIYSKINDTWQPAKQAYAKIFTPKWVELNSHVEIAGRKYISKPEVYRINHTKDTPSNDTYYYSIIKLNTDMTCYDWDSDDEVLPYLYKGLTQENSYIYNHIYKKNSDNNFKICALICNQEMSCKGTVLKGNFRNSYTPKEKDYFTNKPYKSSPFSETSFSGHLDKNVDEVLYSLHYKEQVNCSKETFTHTMKLTQEGEFSLNLELKKKYLGYVTLCYTFVDLWGIKSKSYSYTWDRIKEKPVKIGEVEAIDGTRVKTKLKLNFTRSENINYYSVISYQGDEDTCALNKFPKNSKKHSFNNDLDIPISRHDDEGKRSVCLKLCNLWHQCKVKHVAIEVDRTAPIGTLKLLTQVQPVNNDKYFINTFTFKDNADFKKDVSYYRFSYAYGEDASCEDPSHLENMNLNKRLTFELKDDGEQVLCIFAVDSLNNVQNIEQASIYTWIKDTVKPEVSEIEYQSLIEKGLINKLELEEAKSYELSLIRSIELIEDNPSKIEYSLIQSNESCTKANSWSLNRPTYNHNVFQNDGNYTLCLKATDKADQIIIAEKPFTLDTAPPIMTNVFPSPESVVSHRIFKLKASAKTAVAFEMEYSNETEDFLKGLEYANQNKVNTLESLEHTVVLNELEGNKEIRIFAVDKAGNKSKATLVNFVYKKEPGKKQLINEDSYELGAVVSKKGYLFLPGKKNIYIYKVFENSDFELLQTISRAEYLLDEDGLANRMDFNGEDLLIAAPNSPILGGTGQVFIFRLSGEYFERRPDLDINLENPVNQFGAQITVEDSTLVVRGLSEKTSASDNQSKLYIFNLVDGRWKIKSEVTHNLLETSFNKEK